MFHPIKQWLARRDSALRAERDHQLALVRELVRGLEVLAEGQAKSIEESSKALIELARSSAAQAEGFTTWIRSFATTTPDAALPPNPIADEENEHSAEVEELKRALGMGDSPVAAEFGLALELHQQDFLNAVRKDGPA